MRSFANRPIIIPVAVSPDGTKNDETNRLLADKIERLTREIAELKRKSGKQKKEKAERPQEYSEYKSDGKRKARAMDSIRSYDDFLAVQNYFLERGKIRDWAFWTVGVCFGIRISDLVSLKIKNVLNQDRTFKPKIQIIEKKTSKLNECLITEAVVVALTRYFDSIDWDFSLNDYLFKSQKKGKMTEQHGWRIISSAGRALNLPIVMGSHTMRKSFINVATCLREYTIDMNAVVIAQAHLNHSDQRTTMRYMGALDVVKDEDRLNVSDFALGRSKVNKLIDGLTKEV